MDKKTYEVKAPGKINLGLYVGPRRKDGFHPISSIFQKIDLFDQMIVQIEEAPRFSITITGLEEYCLPGASTLEKIGELWSETTEINCSVNVQIKKNIPSQAGLGGGSSDGASLLLTLEEHFNNPLSMTQKIKVAAAVG
ncbi:MAG: 4-(cytidine 5'-diphospho)-2-C-methyl-D-erythritol kinase, partial [Sphaerochaetaceae bacterium]|nr:4-(cytidine 5'-diphospho)-2-C-methyl-D-erythritol kinase [Sphaerochaetaceae bacterium]